MTNYFFGTVHFWEAPNMVLNFKGPYMNLSIWLCISDCLSLFFFYLVKASFLF